MVRNGGWSWLVNQNELLGIFCSFRQTGGARALLSQQSKKRDSLMIDSMFRFILRNPADGIL